MPARVRAMLVAYASLLLDRDGRAVEPTPLGLVALRAAEAKAG
jgi:hypothetical protein